VSDVLSIVMLMGFAPRICAVYKLARR